MARVARRGTGWHASHRRLRSVPRLSNGSEWLFHGKDEVRGVPRGDMVWLVEPGGTEGTSGALGTQGGQWFPGGQRVASGTQRDRGWLMVSRGTEGGQWFPGDRGWLMVPRGQRVAGRTQGDRGWLMVPRG